ncbi:head-tail connector protein [Pseudaestuariivita atlantica]|uniref:Gene transfer agent protein n=1 Tax=Pseudaestuariivita atlantica TaxID=1317121 RepID=A0A0L1JMD8_9RHOB|nr:head-tail connector protein [Pseudaestuariivita atlantica]KNG92921.1 gene transfer agent protein [Pseudaestuariivita atlantica]
MMLVEETQVADAALPVAELKAHLRMGTGFAEDTVQDGVLVGFLRAALAAIEARTGKALFVREFSWSLSAWRDPEGQVLPVAPVNLVTAVTLIDAGGDPTVVGLETVRLEADTHRPRLRPRGACLPTIPTGGSAQVVFTAGYGAVWSDIPPDLQQAVLMLAAHYYEYRHDVALGQGCMPFGVTALIERFRVMRVFGGVPS